jgi:hypothetical protein
MSGEFHYEPANPNDTVAEVSMPSTLFNLANGFCGVELPY